jgi:Thioredoxin reductase
MIYDVIIIGGGVSGTTAALYLKMYGLDTAIIEKELIGGKLNYISEINNVPGVLPIEGEKLAKNMLKQLENIHTEIIYEEVTSVEYTNNLYQIYTTGKVYISRYLIIAVGSTPKKIEGLKASYCEICEGHLYKGKNVAVIGGGDSSFSCAMYLSKICKSVTILIRKDKARASSYLIDKVKRRTT